MRPAILVQLIDAGIIFSDGSVPWGADDHIGVPADYIMYRANDNGTLDLQYTASLINEEGTVTTRRFSHSYRGCFNVIEYAQELEVGSGE